MSTFDNNLTWSSKYSPGVTAMILLFVSFVGFMLIGPVIGMLLGFLMYDGDLSTYYQQVLSNPMGDVALKLPLFILQGTASLMGVISYNKLMQLAGMKAKPVLSAPVTEPALQPVPSAQ